MEIPDTVFYTTAGGDISGGVDWKPTRNQHLANVKYVHDQINKLYYPARFSWIVKTETSAGPVSGQIQWNNTSMSNSTEVRVHFKSYDGKLDLFDVADEKVVYNGPSNSSMMITGYYIGSDTDQKWKWKGTANITKITVYLIKKVLMETVILNVNLVPIKRLMLHLMTVVDITSLYLVYSNGYSN